MSGYATFDRAVTEAFHGSFTGFKLHNCSFNLQSVSFEHLDKGSVLGIMMKPDTNVADLQPAIEKMERAEALLICAMHCAGEMEAHVWHALVAIDDLVSEARQDLQQRLRRPAAPPAPG